jgi:hypothetical protein
MDKMKTLFSVWLPYLYCSENHLPPDGVSLKAVDTSLGYLPLEIRTEKLSAGRRQKLRGVRNECM